MWGMQAHGIMVSGSAGTGSCWAWSMRYGGGGGESGRCPGVMHSDEPPSGQEILMGL